MPEGHINTFILGFLPSDILQGDSAPVYLSYGVFSRWGSLAVLPCGQYTGSDGGSAHNSEHGTLDRLDTERRGETGNAHHRSF